MKKFALTLLLVLTSSKAFAAPELFCRYQVKNSPVDNYTAGVKDKLEGNCKDLHGNQYRLAFEGIGLGLRLNTIELFTLSCPLVRKSILTSHSFRGLRVSASYLIGADVAILSNQNLGFCLLTGVVGGAGASVTIDKMSVYKN